VPNDRNFQLTKIFKSRIENFIKYYDFDQISERESGSEGETDSLKIIEEALCSSDASY